HGARRRVTLRALAAGATTGPDLEAAGGSAQAARSLARKGFAIEGRRAVRRIPAEFALTEEDPSRDAVATTAQSAAIGAIALGLGSGRGFLLHGVTASGKTEVYLRVAAEALRRGGGVIVVVAAVVLGSATPRVTTYELARSEEITLLTLPERIGDLSLPPTTIVDLRLELRTGNRGTLSRALRTALVEAVRKGDQAILFLNRRG